MPEQDYKSGLSILFWGLIIAFLDFNINEVSILPGPLGYLLVLSAIKKIKSVNTQVIKLRPWAYILLGISLITWFSPFFKEPQMASQDEIGNLNIDIPFFSLFSIVEAIELIVSIVFVFLLMNVYISLAKASMEDRWVPIYEKRKTFYVWINMMMIFLLPLAVVWPNTFAFILIITLVLSLVAMIRILMTAYRIKKLSEESKILTDEIKEMPQPFFEKRKGWTIALLMVYALMWTASWLITEQYRLHEPILLPAYIATIDDELNLAEFSLLYNGEEEKQIQSINELYFEQRTSLHLSYFVVNQVQFPEMYIQPEDSLSNMTTITLNDGIQLTDLSALRTVNLEKVEDHSAYLENISGTATSEGEQTSRWKVLQPFTVRDFLVLPYDEELNEILTMTWSLNSGVYEMREEGQFFEGDYIEFTEIPNEGLGELTTVVVPRRMKIETDEGEKMIDVGWIAMYPSFQEDQLKEFVKQHK